jgi:hypothetical protein
MQLKARGYKILPNRGKIPAVKGWSDPGYAARELTEKRIAGWVFRFSEAESTGIRIEDGLAVIDIDVDDPLADLLFDALAEIAPEIYASAPVRYGGGEHKMALFVRLDPTEAPFVRRGTWRYLRPGQSALDDDSGDGVEIFGGKPAPTGNCSRQFGAFGPHSYHDDGSVARYYEWAGGVSLLDIAPGELPVLRLEMVDRITTAFERLADAAGWRRVTEFHDDDGGASIYDITASSRFDIEIGPDQVNYALLVELWWARGDLRCSSAFIPGDKGSNRSKCRAFWSHYHECVGVYDYETGSKHFPTDYAPPDPEKLAAGLKALGAGVRPRPQFELARGQVRLSMLNARLAIEHTGISCRHDTFHNQLWLDQREVTDSELTWLRGRMLELYQVDFTDRHIRDAVLWMAFLNQFDPMAQMLDAAEADWDGRPRLDRMAAEIFHCEDTALNSQCLRKVMIAAVARVRQPGCKFDTIPIFESPEGWGKSTAWRILAGDSNFSDVAIIGRDHREVTEQLAAVWIHENAELSGMRKAEVDMVKTFASRQVDRARPAYGRFLVNQPRHSIEIGTTNEMTQYLQSQTGNRRFWPMLLIAPVDLARLAAERLQLWGEAAHAERQGESLVLNTALWAAAAAEQEKRRVVDDWEDALDSMRLATNDGPLAGADFAGNSAVIQLDPESGDEMVTTRTIFEVVLGIALARRGYNSERRLATLMRARGWTAGRLWVGGERIRGYRRPSVHV